MCGKRNYRVFEPKFLIQLSNCLSHRGKSTLAAASCVTVSDRRSGATVVVVRFRIYVAMLKLRALTSAHISVVLRYIKLSLTLSINFSL
jgi:hypothetical protein